MVTVKYYWDVGTADSVAEFRYLINDTDSNTRPSVRFGVRPQLLSTQRDRQNLLLITIVR